MTAATVHHRRTAVRPTVPVAPAMAPPPSAWQADVLRDGSLAVLGVQHLDDERSRLTPVGPSGPTRLQLPTARADLRVTWHQDDDTFVLSLWHDDVCVGTAPLGATEAAGLAGFLVGRLGDRAAPVSASG
jgi:hypothetical protein